MSAAELVSGLAGLVWIALVGRVVLAWLPAGLPGAHAPRELARTWAASHLCGLVALAGERALFDALDVAPVTSPVTSPGAWIAAAPWLVLGAARVVLAPAALVPRHEPPREAPGPFAHLVGLALAAALCVPVWRAIAYGDVVVAPLAELPAHGVALPPGARTALGAPVALAALVVLVGLGLERARRAPFARRLVLAVFALTPVVQQLAASGAGGALDVALALTLGGGAACAVAWVRRADRRAAALAIVGIAGAPLLDARAAGPALALVLGIALATRAPARRAWLVRALPCWAGAVALVAGHARPPLPGVNALLENGAALARAMAEPGTWELRWWFVVAALVLGAWRLARAPGVLREPAAPAADGVAIEGTEREQAGLALATALGWLALAAAWSVPWREALEPGLWRHGALLPLAALGTLLVGLTLVPVERPTRGALVR